MPISSTAIIFAAPSPPIWRRPPITAKKSPPQSPATICLACSFTPKRASATDWRCSNAFSTEPIEKMSLIIFPAIDLKGGQVVRLAEGDLDRATVIAHDQSGRAELCSHHKPPQLHLPHL